MSRPFEIKQGNLSPALEYEVITPGFNLVGAEATFSMFTMAGEPVIEGMPAIVNTSGTYPVLGFDWRPGDTETVGTYRCEFDVTYVDDTGETVPNKEFLYVRVNPRGGV